MDRQSFMWGQIKYVTWWIMILHKNFGKPLIIAYVYLWLQAAPYDCTNTVSIWFHCNGLIHSLHKENIYKTSLHANFIQLVLPFRILTFVAVTMQYSLFKFKTFIISTSIT